MALGNFYLGRNGLTDDTLDRVAFYRMNDIGNIIETFHFMLNPSNMTNDYPARNDFFQTLHDVNMQGYGMGMHTIQIQGQTGFRQWQTIHRGPTGWDTAFQKYKKLKKIILDQENNAHDSGEPEQMSTLFFCNYSDEECYRVELDQNGIQFQQSNQDPLTFYYTISMVVIAKASDPAPDEYTNSVLGNVYPQTAQQPTQTKTNISSTTVNVNNAPTVKQTKKNQYSHDYPYHPVNTTTTAQNAQQGKKSIISGEPKKDMNTLTDKSLQAISALPDNKQVALFNTINQYNNDGQRLVHVTYDGRRPLDILLGNGNDPTADQVYWQKWVSQTQQQKSNDIGVLNSAATNYLTQAGDKIVTKADGDRWIYNNGNPVAIISPDGGSLFYFAKNAQSKTNPNHVVIDSTGTVISAPNDYNIQYVIKYELNCDSHVVWDWQRLAPQWPLGKFVAVHPHVHTRSFIFEWGKPTHVPVSDSDYWRHYNSQGTHTWTTHVAGEGVIYWDGQGHISNTNQTGQSDLQILSYSVSNSNEPSGGSPLNIDNIAVPDSVFGNEHNGNHPRWDSTSTDTENLSTDNNYVMNDYHEVNSMVTQIFDADLKYYYGTVATQYSNQPSFIDSTDNISSDTDSDFLSDLQDYIDYGNQNLFSGTAVPDVDSSSDSTDYWKEKDNNYLIDQNGATNPNLNKFITLWISKFCTPNVINNEQTEQNSIDQNTQNEADDSDTNTAYIANNSGNTDNDAQYADNVTPVYRDKDGDLIQDLYHNQNDLLIPMNNGNHFVQENGQTILESTPVSEDSNANEAVNGNDTQNANDVEHASWQDGVLVYNPNGNVTIPTNGTQLVGTKLHGRNVQEVQYVSSNTTATGTPVPDQNYGQDTERAIWSNGNLIPDADGNIVVSTNGTTLETKNGKTIIVDTGSNTTSNPSSPTSDVDNATNTEMASMDSSGNLVLDPHGTIYVPTNGTTVVGERINGVMENVITNTGSNTTSNPVTPANVTNLAKDTERASLVDGTLILDPKGSIYVSKNGTMTKQDPVTGNVVIYNTGSNTTPNPNSPVNVATASTDFEWVKDDHGKWVIIPKNGTEVVQRNGKNYIVNTGSTTTDTGPVTPNNLSNNAISKSEETVKENGKIIIKPIGQGTTSNPATPSNEQVQMNATDLTTIGDVNGNLIVEPNQYSTTDMGKPIPTDVAKYSNDWIQVKLSNGKLKVMPNGDATNGTDFIPTVLHGKSSSYKVLDVHGRMIVEPIGESTNNFRPSDTVTNLSRNADNWARITTVDGQIIVEPTSNSTNDYNSKDNPAFISGYGNSYTTVNSKGQIEITPCTTTNGHFQDPSFIPGNVVNSTNVVDESGHTGLYRPDHNPDLIMGKSSTKNVKK